METVLNKPKKTRLQFIDLARSVAILLMLEGHFIDDSLMEIYRDPNNTVYFVWRFIRGFTAPTFLTVTGIVFVYLLLGNEQERFKENIRVKKGFKRVVELLFWGYLLQYYAFHVLQCIAVGITFILLIYGLSRLIKVIPIWILYGTMGCSLFATQIYLNTLPDEHYLPVGFPEFIQNIIRGKHSMFPIVPWMGYTMFGAMLGSLFFKYKEKIKTWIAPIIMLSIGSFLFFFLKDTLVSIDELMNHKTYFLYTMDWLYERLGMVFIILGSLMIIEKLTGEIKQNWFLKMGQNTLTIFILHMIVLYGSITRLGLTKLFHERLNPWESAIGAIAFITLFVWIIYYIELIREKLSFITTPISKTVSKWFGIS